MANADLLSYIRRAMGSGSPKDKIIGELKGAGWSEADIASGFAEVEGASMPPPQSVPGPGKQKLTGILVALAVVFLVVGSGYAYFMKLGPFAALPYTENNLLSGIVSTITRINTSSYLFSGSLAVGARDAGAKPFVVNKSDNQELRKQYQRDVKRISDISSILSNLKYFGTKPFPSTLGGLQLSNSYYGGKPSIEDPLSKKLYGYAVTEGGKNFELSVVLETADALSSLKKSLFSSEKGTTFDGQKIKFTKDSYSYLYISSEPPKPFLVELGDSFSILPVEMNAKASVSAQADWRKAESADWKFNINAEGDFGDLTYKVDIDSLKKDDIYYFKINNMPSFILAFFGNIKGQWIKIDPAQASSTDQGYYGNSSSYIESQFPKMEKSYKDESKKFQDLIKKAVILADSENLIVLKNPPSSEKIDNRVLYKYELKIRKEAIVPFYKKLLDEADKQNVGKDYPFFADRGYLNYLESPEFGAIFDYYDANTSLTLWADAQGFPAIVSYSVRIIPPDSATTLKDRQVNLLFKFVLRDINSSVKITKPENAKSLNELQSGGPLDEARKKSRDARRKADLAQLRVANELYYDSNNGYPAKLIDLAPKYIPQIPKDPDGKTNYSYAAFTSKGKRISYHLGASLEEENDNYLLNDADCNSKTGADCGQKSAGTWATAGAFDGSDEQGCNGEKDRYCYDVSP